MPISVRSAQARFAVTEFRPNDVISLKANDNYRDPAKPAFATVTFKGGGDAAAAGRSVLETVNSITAWNLQLAPDVLANMQAAGKGKVVSAFGTLVERIMVNMTNPDPALGDERATAKHAHRSCQTWPCARLCRWRSTANCW